MKNGHGPDTDAGVTEEVRQRITGAREGHLLLRQVADCGFQNIEPVGASWGGGCAAGCRSEARGRKPVAGALSNQVELLGNAGRLPRRQPMLQAWPPLTEVMVPGSRTPLLRTPPQHFIWSGRFYLF